jgi:hypothetical protein
MARERWGFNLPRESGPTTLLAGGPHFPRGLDSARVDVPDIFQRQREHGNEASRPAGTNSGGRLMPHTGHLIDIRRTLPPSLYFANIECHCTTAKGLLLLQRLYPVR